MFITALTVLLENPTLGTECWLLGNSLSCTFLCSTLAALSLVGWLCSTNLPIYNMLADVKHFWPANVRVKG